MTAPPLPAPAASGKPGLWPSGSHLALLAVIHFASTRLAVIHLAGTHLAVIHLAGTHLAVVHFADAHLGVVHFAGGLGVVHLVLVFGWRLLATHDRQAQSQ